MYEMGRGVGDTKNGRDDGSIALLMDKSISFYERLILKDTTVFVVLNLLSTHQARFRY